MCGMADFRLEPWDERGLTAVLERAAATGRHDWAHACPHVGNAGSNAVCARAGFVLVEEVDFEYPKGSWIRCNDWRFDLRPARR
jgi:RimJ/RimL family protein N-acetyltransferase